MFYRSGYRFPSRLTMFALALGIGGIADSAACAQSGNPVGGRFNLNGYGNRGYYPYSGYGGSYPGYNIYGNFGVYGYPGSGIEGGATNSGYDPGYGGYPSYGGYGITNGPVATGRAAAAAPPRRLLGIDEDPVTLPDGTKAMKVGRVFPGSAAEKAGLQAGDVIRSVNGYQTEQRGNLAWIIANAMPTNELKLSVQTARDGQMHVIAATLR